MKFVYTCIVGIVFGWGMMAGIWLFSSPTIEQLQADLDLAREENLFLKLQIDKIRRHPLTFWNPSLEPIPPQAIPEIKGD
jgi:hypothetical protein